MVTRSARHRYYCLAVSSSDMRFSRTQPSDFRAGLGFLVLIPIYFVLAGFLTRQYSADRVSAVALWFGLLMGVVVLIGASKFWPRFVPAPVSAALAAGSWALGIWMLMEFG